MSLMTIQRLFGWDQVGFFFFLLFLFDCGMADDDRTARDAHAKSLAKSGGRTRQDLHSGNRIGVQVLGYGIGSSSIDRFTGFSSFCHLPYKTNVDGWSNISENATNTPFFITLPALIETLLVAILRQNSIS